MPIHILDSADPLSDVALKSDTGREVRNARSGAGRVLRIELTRYCRGEVNGRSFLIAGHRGAGKTTMVADAIDQVLRRSRQADAHLLRPLPVFLHGPSLFELEPREVDARMGLRARRQAAAGAAEPQKKTAPAEVALQHIILGLHRAVGREFARGYRRVLVETEDSRALPDAHRARRAELAAQLEVELAAHPSAQRLLEFWEMAGALQDGVLFEPVAHAPGGLSPAGSRLDQGARELVAMNWICGAYQRISGEIKALDKSMQSSDENAEKSVGVEARGGDLVKPLVSVLAGGGVAAGTAAAGLHSVGAALL
ncbi:MAG: hypothetical protein ABJD97_16600, partial [Betaproteobacteria bacterium]